jgi:hypothetical protein
MSNSSEDILEKAPAWNLLVRSCFLSGSYFLVRLLLPVPTFLFLSPGLLFSFQPDLVSFCAIVHERFLEPGMLQGLLGGDTLLGIVDKNPSQEVEELLVEVRMARYCFLQLSV